MVERLREAIERARRERENHADAARDAPSVSVAAPARSARAPDRPASLWDALPTAEIADGTLRRARIVTADKSDPASAVFDVIRTRMLKTCQQNGWRRIGFTSPTKSCGKSFVTLNLAFSFARNPQLRCVVVDLDLHRPTIAASLFGAQGKDMETDVVKFLTGRAGIADVARKLRPNLVVLGAAPANNSAEILHNPGTLAALDALQEALEPDIMLIDLPPVFVGDDVLSICGALDAMALVASAQQTTARDVLDAERMFSGYTAFLGVLLNKVEPGDTESYDYDYGYGYGYGYAADNVA